MDTLAAVRVEDEEVLTATHQLLTDLHAEGRIDGFRIDHPDGLANPRQYFADLQRLTGGCWVVIEKILEADETLPDDFECAGTTGYDAMLRVGGLFQDSAGLPRLNVLWDRISGSSDWFNSTLAVAKKQVVRNMLFTEITRLTSIAVAICDGDIRLRDHTRRQLGDAISALLREMDRYRAYVEPGRVAAPKERQVILEAAERAREDLPPNKYDTLDLIVAFACGDPGTGDENQGAETLPAPGEVTVEFGDETPSIARLRAEFMIRFAQTCGPVMAKSKEDTAFYRWNRFIGVNEVGSEPTVVGVTPDAFHDFCQGISQKWPATMTTLSTHDTKRSIDVRSRLSALTEFPKDWEHCVAQLRVASAAHLGELVDGAMELFLWQTLAGTWRLEGTRSGTTPISEERLAAYLTKAMREAKQHTSWTEIDEAYEEAVQALAAHALADEDCRQALDTFAEVVAESVRNNALGQRLIQLTMPGVPDVYQGCELVDLSLVDPDNRRPVDFDARRGMLASLATSPPDSLDSEALMITTRALRLRRDHPEAFRGPDAEYQPIATTTGHVVSFARRSVGQDNPVAITIATRLPSQVSAGWDEHRIILPEGTFQDLLTGRIITGGDTLLADILIELPVALLVPSPEDVT